MGDDGYASAVPRLVECVPNVSEGRRRDVIDRLARAIRDVPGVRLLDQTSDVDHNRSVFTFAGDADVVTAAAHALIAAAFGEIDMRSHKGEHPRAHVFGHEVAARHQIPVYFYARAALRPERIRLPDIRKPQYEGLAELLATTHVPDAGPAVLHAKAGAIVVGARPPLIAFNIELDTADVKIAKRIAKEIRESSGGLPSVQALGFELTDPPRAQVSMNLLDTTVTSLATAWHEVERRASDAGVKVLRGELIGLLPLDAALEVTAAALKLENFDRSRVIESHFIE